MKTEGNINEEIQQLTKTLQKLEIAQAEINKEINKTKQSINHIKTTLTNDSEKTRRRIEYEEYERSNTIETGDEITIRNPKDTKDKKGTVTGFTPTGYIKILTHKGNKTRRLPFNVIITNKAK